MTASTILHGALVSVMLVEAMQAPALPYVPVPHLRHGLMPHLRM